LPVDSDGERRRERITRSRGNWEALPLDRSWKAEQIGGGKAISLHLHHTTITAAQSYCAEISLMECHSSKGIVPNAA
jgi:hypothetical protein